VFNGLWARLAVKSYAGKLRPRLEHDYGRSETYSDRQIRHAVAVTKLNPKFIVLGYGAFLPKARFDELKPTMPIKLEYEEARILFLDSEPITLESRNSPRESAPPETGS